jgi:predicted RNase H-like nuclease (RuvC/YqgF family)
MKKPRTDKRRAIDTLKMCIRESRKMARQINRKLESLAQLNKMREAAQAELVRICGLK